jgi:hypothetical protein
LLRIDRGEVRAFTEAARTGETNAAGFAEVLNGTPFVPYLHARPAQAGELVTFDLPEAAGLQNVTDAVAAILKAVSKSQLSVTTGRDLVAMIDVQRKSIELVEIERRADKRGPAHLLVRATAAAKA